MQFGESHPFSENKIVLAGAFSFTSDPAFEEAM